MSVNEQELRLQRSQHRTHLHVLVCARHLEDLLQRGDAQARGTVLRSARTAHAADARKLRWCGEVKVE